MDPNLMYQQQQQMNYGMCPQPIIKERVNPYFVIHKSIQSVVFLLCIVSMCISLVMILVLTGTSLYALVSADSDKDSSKMVDFVQNVIIDLLLIVGIILMHFIGKLFGKKHSE